VASTELSEALEANPTAEGNREPLFMKKFPANTQFAAHKLKQFHKA